MRIPKTARGPSTAGSHSCLAWDRQHLKENKPRNMGAGGRGANSGTNVKNPALFSGTDCAQTTAAHIPAGLTLRRVIWDTFPGKG